MALEVEVSHSYKMPPFQTVPTAAPTMGPTSTPQAVKPHKAKTVKLRTTTSAPTTPTTGSPLVVEEQIDGNVKNPFKDVKNCWKPHNITHETINSLSPHFQTPVMQL